MKPRHMVMIIFTVFLIAILTLKLIVIPWIFSAREESGTGHQLILSRADLALVCDVSEQKILNLTGGGICQVGTSKLFDKVILTDLGSQIDMIEFNRKWLMQLYLDNLLIDSKITFFHLNKSLIKFSGNACQITESAYWQKFCLN